MGSWRPRLAAAIATLVLGAAVVMAMMGVRTRYSCGEGWEVSETSWQAAFAACSIGDVPTPTIAVDHQSGTRFLVLVVGLLVAAVPLRIASEGLQEEARLL
jgi:hypothetical protein